MAESPISESNIDASAKSERYMKIWPGLRVRHLIYWSEKSSADAFIVFIDDDCDLDWKWHGPFPDNSQIGKVWNDIAFEEIWLKNWPVDLKVSAKRALGEALARMMDGESENSQLALKAAKRFVSLKGKEVSRYWTLQACSFGAAIAVLWGALSIVFQTPIRDIIGTTPWRLEVAAAAGAVGALLSVILRLGRVDLDARAERRLHFAEGVRSYRGRGYFWYVSRRSDHIRCITAIIPSIGRSNDGDLLCGAYFRSERAASSLNNL
jgi:hypothetical protein